MSKHSLMYNSVEAKLNFACFLNGLLFNERVTQRHMDPHTHTKVCVEHWTVDCGHKVCPGPKV